MAVLAAWDSWLAAHPHYDDWLWTQRFNLHAAACLVIGVILTAAIVRLLRGPRCPMSLLAKTVGIVTAVGALNWIAILAYRNALAWLLHAPECGGYPDPVLLVVVSAWQGMWAVIAVRRTASTGTHAVLCLWMVTAAATCVIVVPLCTIANAVFSPHAGAWLCLGTAILTIPILARVLALPVRRWRLARSAPTNSSRRPPGGTAG
jgi:predicted transcriptional regulator